MTEKNYLLFTMKFVLFDVIILLTPKRSPYRLEAILNNFYLTKLK